MNYFFFFKKNCVLLSSRPLDWSDPGYDKATSHGPGLRLPIRRYSVELANLVVLGAGVDEGRIEAHTDLPQCLSPGFVWEGSELLGLVLE